MLKKFTKFVMFLALMYGAYAAGRYRESLDTTPFCVQTEENGIVLVKPLVVSEVLRLSDGETAVFGTDPRSVKQHEQVVACPE